MRLCFGHQAVEVGERAVLRIDVFVVGNVVAEIDLGRRIHRGNPDRVYAQGFKVAEPLGDAVQVARAIAVRVLKTARIDLVHDRMLPPDLTGSLRLRWNLLTCDLRWHSGGRKQAGKRNYFPIGMAHKSLPLRS